MTRTSIVQAITAAVGLAVTVGGLWLAIAMPRVRCVRDFDAVGCEDRIAVKLLIGVLASVVGVLVVYVATKMEE
jgi:hypothetical protein